MPARDNISGANPFTRSVRKFLRSNRGNVAALTAILILPLAALLGMATEGGSWYLITRAMQNAADSAVIAAATNGGNDSSTTPTDYVNEGKAIATSYGFTGGAYTIVNVPAPANYSTVPACATSTCYQVRIRRTVPIYMMELVGFKGNTTVGSVRAQQFSAVALAKLVTVTAPFCLTATGGGSLKKGNAITADGVPKSSIGCNIQTGASANCNGKNGLTSGWSDAVGSNDCGTKQHSITSVTDPYKSLASNIPPVGGNCPNGYYPENYVGAGPSTSWPTTNKITGSFTMPAVQYYCGDVAVTGTGTKTITTAAGGSVMVIVNGTLDIQAFNTLQASGLTIIFTGTGSGAAYDQYSACSGKKCSTQVSNGPTGGGTLDLSSPTSGTWSGMDVYQDPNLPEQTLASAGNSPTWNISGIMYFPVTDFAASGAVNKSTNGYSCFTLVVNSILVNGTGNLFYSNPQSQCALQGVTSPTNSAYVVGQLVY